MGVTNSIFRFEFRSATLTVRRGLVASVRLTKKIRLVAALAASPW